ncbi:hypothetical protein LY01_01091 [Nonlabens xylanidelens]|uniref:Uncharacterized protein n=1 Tax=Nonlabens xylanidelens TaxID=191564 RepID=A0A2S6IMQ1_9FLAO|nr:hypothetical protein [Nonlabens xylanidelens]PPK95503.1 hypothetical protein LY01_01091 [Nonlabens xylanidelens]PQJ22315.1 hypothetical protein BST94_01710 [Nonlabens xylanidelens]
MRVFKDKPSQVFFYQVKGGNVEEVYGGSAFAKAEKFQLDSLKPIKTRLLPIFITPYIGYDIGQVGIENQNSSKFYNSYGGLFTSQVSYFHGKDGGRLQLSLILSK